MAEGLLLTERLSFSRHGTVIAEYGRLFAKTGRLDRRFHRLLQSMLTARHTADYDIDAEFSDAEVREAIDEGRTSLDAARDYLERKSAEEATGQQ